MTWCTVPSLPPQSIACRTMRTRRGSPVTLFDAKSFSCSSDRDTPISSTAARDQAFGSFLTVLLVGRPGVDLGSILARSRSAGTRRSERSERSAIRSPCRKSRRPGSGVPERDRPKLAYMPSAGIRLGVDFGTSNTVAVVRWPDGRSRPLLFDGSPLLPSAVYAEPNSAAGAPGVLVVGRDAVHSARLDPARFEPNPKRRIDDGTVLLGDRELPVGEMMAAVLRRVRDEWRRTVGGVDPDVTLTFPASWGATRRLVLADAAATAGLGQVRLVPEPVAAAAYFTQVLGREVPIGAVVVVHDFGAGTFDASVVARTSSGFEVLAVDGRDDIGGIDIDDAIVAHIGRLYSDR